MHRTGGRPGNAILLPRPLADRSHVKRIVLGHGSCHRRKCLLQFHEITKRSRYESNRILSFFVFNPPGIKMIEIMKFRFPEVAGIWIRRYQIVAHVFLRPEEHDLLGDGHSDAVRSQQGERRRGHGFNYGNIHVAQTGQVLLLVHGIGSIPVRLSVQTAAGRRHLPQRLPERQGLGGQHGQKSVEPIHAPVDFEFERGRQGVAADHRHVGRRLPLRQQQSLHSLYGVAFGGGNVRFALIIMHNWKL